MRVFIRIPLRPLLLAVVVATTSAFAAAQVELATFSGDTTGEPTWRRPFSAGSGTSGSCFLSTIGTAVPYEVTTFTTDITGDYVVRIDGDTHPDTYVHLYEGAFDPADQCLNLIALDDDDGFILNVSIVGAGTYTGRNPLTLLAGQEYNVVVSGYENDDFGSYNGTISGPAGATVTIVGAPPPPACEVALSVTASGTSVPSSGGQVVLGVTATNNGDAVAPLALTLDVSGPTSFSRNLGRPDLEPGASFSRRVPLNFTRPMPDGTYVVVVDLDVDGEDCDAASFTITKGAPPRLAGETAEAAQRAEAEKAAAARPATGGALAPGASAASVAVGVRPNPFAGRTAISFEVAEAAAVRLAVYDVLGREVAVLVDGHAAAGAHQATFDARGLAPGTYVYRLVVGNDVRTGRMTLER